MAPPPARELLAEAVASLRAAGVPDAPLDASVLLAHVLGVPRGRLLLEPDAPVAAPDATRFRALVADRARLVPVAYLTGTREFFGVELAVDPRVLIPRPDTECLVEAALALLPPASDAVVVDVGTGSGCILAALLSARPRLRAVALDLSADALAVARRNLPGVPLVRGAGTAALAPGRVDLLVSNPPYVDPATRPDLAADLDHEPELALFAGDAGRAVLAELLADAPRVLRPGGRLLFEHGHDQGAATREAARRAGLAGIETGRDLAGRERFLRARAPGGAP